MEFRVVISDPKTGKAYQKVITGANANRLIGKQIGDIINGTIVELPPDYELQITGGTDRSGIPMRPDIPGGGKRYVLLASPPGYRPKRKGERRRKLVRGNTITEEIVQVNAILVSGAEKT